MTSTAPTCEVWDVAIVGGGIAGSVAAFHSAQSGLRTLILEKERAAHQKVCGEFLSADGIAILSEIGVDFRALGAAPIRGFRLHGPTRSCETKLPEPAFGLSRWALDEALLERARVAGAEVRMGCQVREKGEPAERMRLETSRGWVEARRVIVATGKTEFRSVQSRTGRDSGMVGFKMHLKLKPSLLRRLSDNIDLFVFKHGYGGLSPIENGLANFCCLLEKKALREIGTTWDAISYHIARHNLEASLFLDGAQEQFRHCVTVGQVPFGFLHGSRSEPGVFCVGDQLAVIPSLTGDGMSIAAMTGREAAHALFDPATRGLRPAGISSVYHRQMRTRLRPQIASGYYLHRLFKRPQAVDWATYVVNGFPQIIDLLFSRTRCQSDERWLKAAVVKRLST